ncbi:hypothetical protein GEMRC1_011815 [Eukaryota sp. GEM-RC1]
MVWTHFCLSHLLEWLDQNEGCPSCRSPVEKTRLCVNIKLRDAVAFFKQEQTAHLCDECEDTDATVYCPDCKTDLCSDCNVMIHRPKTLKKHVVTPLIKKHTIIAPQCPKHHPKDFDLFCTHCSSSLCSTCAILGDHDGHKPSLLPFKEGRSLIEGKINSSNQELSLMDKQLSEDIESTCKRISELFDQSKVELSSFLNSAMTDSNGIMNNVITGKR